MTEVLPATRPAATDDQDWDRFSHIVLKESNPLVALCGKILSNPHPDAKRFQLCPTCIEICQAKGWTIPHVVV